MVQAKTAAAFRSPYTWQQQFCPHRQFLGQTSGYLPKARCRHGNTHTRSLARAVKPGFLAVTQSPARSGGSGAGRRLMCGSPHWGEEPAPYPADRDRQTARPLARSRRCWMRDFGRATPSLRHAPSDTFSSRLTPLQILIVAPQPGDRLPCAS